ncbi:MAG TPA: glycine zipper domain-containing protein [Mucilaginibacter sp.]|jgi:hypothetical protein|nr:glycine zipper domain-containing protein [Mucilaginibacter sp.]
MKKSVVYTAILAAVLSTSVSATQAQQHKPMSSQAKGAIIGGAGGAVIGGIASHSAGGALIGGAIGAGGGYIIGNEHRRSVEKKRRAAYREAYYRKHGHYPNAYVYKKPTR